MLQNALFETQIAYADVIWDDELLARQDGEDLGIDVEETGERPVCRFPGADAARIAGRGLYFELEID